MSEITIKNNTGNYLLESIPSHEEGRSGNFILSSNCTESEFPGVEEIARRGRFPAESLSLFLQKTRSSEGVTGLDKRGIRRICVASDVICTQPFHMVTGRAFRKAYCCASVNPLGSLPRCPEVP
ncbi:hypothetical protein CDAR_468461 [Caerostris darwini]|uniref:Uncharacterized protein n=1 Tax=Caerostris darwini TaxID=1538125 RepID=A0AAV4Q750_9ARAC|nr:hypothetical protein CDAR_468461 [Caerostris darwini]